MPSPSNHDAVSRRMAVLFVLALALIVWRASRIEPLAWPPYHQATRPGEQLFPIAAPASAERRILGQPTSRVELLRQISVTRADVDDAGPDAPCELFARVSRSHWRRWPQSRADLAALGAPVPDAGVGVRARIAALDLVDDDDGDGRPLDAGEIHAAAVESAAVEGAEVEVYCRAAREPALRGAAP